MTRHAATLLTCLFALSGLSPVTRAQQQVESSPRRAPKMPPQELARWIDQRFAELWKQQGIAPPPLVDDATFMRRVYLDLLGTIPPVSAVRDFVGAKGSSPREGLVRKVLENDNRPDRYASRSAAHLARVWRRVMVPKSSPGAAMAPQLDPWLETQFANNVAYDEFARRLLTTTPQPPRNPLQPGVAAPDASPAVFYRAVGSTPVNITNAVTRLFLGVRIGCAQCHPHPFAEWTQQDFWGMAAFFAPSAPTINDEGGKAYRASFLWDDKPPEISSGQSAREVLARWLVSAENPNFAATAVNRIWQQLCGRGLVAEVDELDQVTKEERVVLDELAKRFAESGFNTRWLIEGICLSKFYQRASLKRRAAADARPTAFRPLKTLTPEQVFDSLEQALGLPIGRVDNGPRHNGLRQAFVARMDEAASESPEDFRSGIPQALMIMNGTLTADATDLEKSRTLRAVVEAPFLNLAQKIETLYLATLTRTPRERELEFLRKHITKQADERKHAQAYAEILWGLLNSPEFVLSR